VVGNLVGCLRRLIGKRFDFGGDNGETTAGVTGAGRLDGGVQREPVGLLGDSCDQLGPTAQGNARNRPDSAKPGVQWIRGGKFVQAPAGVLRWFGST